MFGRIRGRNSVGTPPDVTGVSVVFFKDFSNKLQKSTSNTSWPFRSKSFQIYHFINYVYRQYVYCVRDRKHLEIKLYNFILDNILSTSLSSFLLCFLFFFLLPCYLYFSFISVHPRGKRSQGRHLNRLLNC